MEFRNLKKQYRVLKKDIDKAMEDVVTNANFISGSQVTELEKELAEYVGVKNCITCANGTDALLLAVMAWGVGPGDAVFVPDFTFFSSGEIVANVGATPVFVDVCEDTFNMDPQSLEKAIEVVKCNGILTPKAVVAVDLFGQPADYLKIKPICEKYGLLLLEDSAQGFGGKIDDKMACSFGDISTTSFFPAKPLGCYGDGGAIFTDSDDWAELIRSLRVHGKGSDKYDNIRLGMNSRLDTMQAAILQPKFNAFKKYEVDDINKVADLYYLNLSGIVKTPIIADGFISSWAQYTILLDNREQRDELQKFLKFKNIPAMIYYKKPMHLQHAFDPFDCLAVDLPVTTSICDRVLSLPIDPYKTEEDIIQVVNSIKEYLNN